MTLTTSFYILGLIYFILSILTIIFLIWWVLVHYFRFKEQLEKMKTKLSVAINLKDLKKSPLIAGLLIPFIIFLLKRIGDNKKKKA
jgi:type III secretory pathway component EscT